MGIFLTMTKLFEYMEQLMNIEDRELLEIVSFPSQCLLIFLSELGLQTFLTHVYLSISPDLTFSAFNF